MKTIQQGVESSFADRLAARYNERYCQARHEMTQARNAGDEFGYQEARDEMEFVADFFDDYRTECEKMGIEITVELDYESWEAK